MVRNLLSVVKTTKLAGAMKSMYHSLRQTRRLGSIVLHSNVITNLSPATEFDINGHLLVGTYNTGAAHPRQGRSVLTTQPGATVSHTGTESAVIGPMSVVHVEGDLSIGDSRFNSNVRIICGDRIEIGDRVSAGWGVQLLDDNRHALTINGVEKPQTAPIVIGDDVWLGHDVSVSKGVTIGENTVVASNSVVVDDVPPDTLVGGHPAKELESGDIEWQH